MVNSRWYAVVPALLCALTLGSGACHSLAQTTRPSNSPEEAPADAEGTAGGVRESKPELYYLPDKDGKFIKVPNFSWEEWRRLWESDRKLRSEPPPYEIEGLKIEGKVEDRHAVLDVEARFKLRKLESKNELSWLRIPLRFGNAVLRGRPEHDGPGDQFTDFEATGSGFVFWIRAGEDTQHAVKMTLVVPVDSVGGETSLDLSTPPHVPVDIKLHVPLDDAVATSNNAADTLSSEAPPGGGSQLTIKGAGGDKRISWREAREAPAIVPERLDVTGTIRVTVHSRQYVTSDANLNVRSSAGPIDSFVVRLPPAMRLHSWYSPGNRLEVVGAGAPPDGDHNAAEPQMVLVSVLRKDVTEVNMRLQTELMPLPATSEGAESQGSGSSEAAETPEAAFMETGGFEVLGAAKQQGEIEYTVQGGWSLRWLEGPEVTRLDEPADMASPVRVAARFKYFRQPFSLQLAIERKKRRISVEPTYQLVFSQGEVHLLASLAYHVFGGSVGQLAVDLEGWTVDELVPDKVVDTVPVDLDEVTPLTLRPVGELPAAVETISVEITAHRTLPAEPGPMSVSLPVPLDCTVRPATVSVRSADNIELTPRLDELRGLIPESLAPPPTSADLVEAEYRYRDRGTGEPAIFVCDLQVHKQAISVAVDGSITLAEDRAEVTQVLKYRIDYEKSRYLVLEIPDALLPLDQSDLQVRLGTATANNNGRNAGDDRLLPVQLLADEAGDATTRGSRLAQVDLLSNRKDSLDLVAQYSLPLRPGTADQSIPVPISAILPAVEPATRFLGSTFHVSFPQGLEVSADAAGWQSEPGRATSGLPRGELRFTSSARQSELPLQVKYVDRRTGQSTMVRKAWLQTWLTSDDCQDRAVFRFQTGERRVRIQLPEDALAEGPADIQVAFDRRRIATNSLRLSREQSKIIEVALPDEAMPGEHVLELWYRREQGRPARGRFSIEAPTVLEASRADRSFWQLITPADEHLMWGPPGLTPVLSWKWRGLYWGRQANLSQDSLERWIGSSASDPVPPSANQYLFTTFSSLKSQRVVTLPRHTIMLAISGLTLAAGVLLIYFPPLRHPTVLLCAGVALLAAAVLYPEPALLAGQAAGLGLTLMLIAQFLHWALARRHRTEQVVRGRTLTGSDSKTAEVQFLRSEADSQVTTAAAPLSFRIRATEVK